MADKAGVGEAARAIDSLLSAHFTHEEAWPSGRSACSAAWRGTPPAPTSPAPSR
jgi:hypothetical protein